MEIRNKSFLDFINKSKTADNLLNQYFSENEDVVHMFNKYDDISYLPTSARFLFLYKEHEKYLSKNKLVILEHEEHLHSTIGLLFILEIHTLSQTLIPIDFPNDTKIKYKIGSVNDAVCSVYLFIIMEILKHLYSILSIYLNENEHAKFKLINVLEALNDKDFIKICPFLFKNSEELKRFLEFEIKEIKFEDPFDTRLQIVLNKIKSSFRELPEQIDCNYSRYYNYVELRQRLWDYENDNVALELLLKIYKVGGRNEYLISTGFKLPNIDFVREFGSSIHISENLLPNIFYAESLEESV